MSIETEATLKIWTGTLCSMLRSCWKKHMLW